MIPIIISLLIKISVKVRCIGFSYRCHTYFLIQKCGYETCWSKRQNIKIRIAKKRLQCVGSTHSLSFPRWICSMCLSSVNVDIPKVFVLLPLPLSLHKHSLDNLIAKSRLNYHSHAIKPAINFSNPDLCLDLQNHVFNHISEISILIFHRHFLQNVLVIFFCSYLLYTYYILSIL